MRRFGLENITFPESLKEKKKRIVLISVPSFFPEKQFTPDLTEEERGRQNKSTVISAKLIWGEYSFLTLKSEFW